MAPVTLAQFLTLGGQVMLNQSRFTMSVLAAIFAIGSVAHAKTSLLDDPNYYTLEKAEVVEIDEATIPTPLLKPFNSNFDLLGPAAKLKATEEILKQAGKTVDEAGVLFDKIVNFGKKVYNFVAQGKAVANVETNVSTALPEGTKSWRDFSNWERPASRSYRLTRKNLYGMEVINLVYRVTYVYGGSYAGTGRYIAYASVEPVVVNVMFGFNLQAKASTPLVYNVGTAEQPVGAMNIKVDFSVGSINPLNGVDRGSNSFFISGKGEFAEVR
jgi:hypothetical protein